MKRILTLVFGLFALALSAQQGVKLGIQGGLPFNDFNDEVGVVIGADAGFMWALSEVVDLGVAAGIIYGFSETFQSDVVRNDLTDIQFAPVGGSVRVWPSNSFSFGLDGGQAFGLNAGNDGGIYYRPQMGYLMGPTTELNLSYTAVELEDQSWTTLTLGLLFTIPM